MLVGCLSLVNSTALKVGMPKSFQGFIFFSFDLGVGLVGPRGTCVLDFGALHALSQWPHPLTPPPRVWEDPLVSDLGSTWSLWLFLTVAIRNQLTSPHLTVAILAVAK